MTGTGIGKNPTGPLSGVRILDLTSVVNGAYATQMLADQGADVIKLEDPGGDIMRRPGVPEGRNAEGLGPNFLVLNRNKRSIMLDLKQDKARAAVERIIATCDVFVASVRFDGLKRLGLSYEDVKAIKPDIVYAHAAGFGSDGPYAGLPAYDDLIQAASGMADLIPRTFGGEPAMLPTQAADKVSGLFMAQAIAAALFHRERTGQGQFVEVPMLECVTSFVLVENLYGHAYQPPSDQWGYPRTLNPFRKPFATKDGYIGMLPYSDKHWALFFDIAGLAEEFAAHPEYARMEGRNANIRELYALVEKAAARRTTQEWVDLLRPHSIPVIALNRLEDLEDDVHLKAVGFFEQLEHPQVGRYQLPKPPVKFSASPSSIRSHAPRLGEQTEEILAEAGLSAGQIAEIAGHQEKSGMTAPVRVLRIGIYSGWKVLAAGLVCSGLSIGGTVYVFGLLVLPISSEFNLTRTQMNSGLIALLVGMAVWGALAGRIIDKAPARIVMPIGGLLMSAGAVTIALAESTMTMVLSAVLLLGAGATCGGSLAANAVVSRWFRRRRGRAMGIMALATSAGGFLLPPLMAMLITGYGWRNAVLALGLLVGPLIAISSALFMRDRPDLATLKAAGELGESESPGTAARFAQDEREWSVRDMLRSRNFWLVMIAVALLMGSDQALLSLKVPFYQSQGVSLQAASILLAVQTASAIVGKVSIGFLSERIDVRRIFAAICALHVVALLMFIHWPGYTVMLILLGTLGVAIGGVLPVKLVLIGAVFGSRSFGQVVGAITVAVQAVSILFIYVSGRAFDATGSYDTVFWMFLAGVVVALALVQFVRLPSREDEVDPRMSQAA